MDIEALRAMFDEPIVAWFALLMLVFAVFMGLGIYQSRRTPVDEREPRRMAPPVRPLTPLKTTHSKEIA